MGFEVAYDPGQNIKIANAIEKYPVIYDIKKYPVGEYRSAIDRAWAEVAKQLGVSEGYVKGRWTNIKGCFKRYLRNKARSTTTKDYYLAPYLHFMIPFMNVSRILTQIVHPSIEDIQSSIDVCDATEEFEVELENSDVEEDSFFNSTASDVSGETSLVGNERNADWDFLSSLLPDVQRMDADQKAKFRNSVLTAIDMTLYGDDF